MSYQGGPDALNTTRLDPDLRSPSWIRVPVAMGPGPWEGLRELEGRLTRGTRSEGRRVRAVSWPQPANDGRRYRTSAGYRAEIRSRMRGALSPPRRRDEMCHQENAGSRLVVALV